MASIILSFVGQQDPFSGTTNDEGSIVSLVKHLILEKQQQIKQVFLLATNGTAAGAKDTQEWLHSEFNIAVEALELIQVDEALSQDPIDILLATNAAKEVLIKAKKLISQGDMLEFNASSGTPAMKSTWSILQSAGYAPHSRVWQVRNPRQMQPQQERVFATDLSGLKREFDLSIIKQQLADYNYSGALATIKDSDLNSDLVAALLNYGHRRSSFDFDRAGDAIGKYRDSLSNELVSDIGNLRQKDARSLLKEIYFSAKISIENREYCDFLIAVSQFKENVLRFLLAEIGLEVPDDIRQMEDFWKEVRQYGDRSIYQTLEQSNIKAISLHGNINIPTMIEIIKLSNQYDRLLPNIAKLKDYCGQRNRYIHRLEGVSHIDDAQAVLNNIRNLL